MGIHRLYLCFRSVQVRPDIVLAFDWATALILSSAHLYRPTLLHRLFFMDSPLYLFAQLGIILFTGPGLLCILYSEEPTVLCLLGGLLATGTYYWSWPILCLRTRCPRWFVDVG